MARPKTTSASPTPRWLTRTRPDGRAISAISASPSIASGIRIARELAGLAVRQELVAVIDEEQVGVAGDLGGDMGRVVDGHDQRVRHEPVIGHHLAPVRAERGGGDRDIGAGDGRAGVRGGAAAATPSVALATPASDAARSGCRSKMRREAPGNRWPTTGRWLRPLHSGADERDLGRAPAQRWRERPDRHARDGRRVAR